MNRIKRLISIILIIFLMIGRAWPMVVLAEELPVEEPAESQEVEEAAEENNEVSPTPTPEAELDNDADVMNDIDSTAITGENEIVEPTPTPTPIDEVVDPESTEGGSQSEPSCQPEELEEGESCPEPTPTIEPDLETEQETTPEASLDNSQEETDPAVIDTGDAVSTTVVENSVNSTEVGSEILHQTLNIFVPGDVDLTMSPLDIAANVFTEENNNEPVVNVMVIDAENVAFLGNDIVALADTGNNEIGEAQEAAINTGNAYTLVSLLNKVNTTIIGSTIHIVTINIFGDVDGNILLPEFTTAGGECCGEVIHIGNTAVLENNVDSEAISGQNTITTTDTGNASITTGDASSIVNVLNIVNTSLVGVTFYNLYINALGVWIGDFLGWDNLEGIEGGGNLAINSSSAGNGNGDCPDCIGDTFIGNEAYVTNNVSSTANTGGNSIEGGGDINTGNAYSSVSIINFINSTIINSFGFFGFINIFGFLEGDIGGASLFDKETEPESEREAVVEQQNGEPGFTREAGGKLDIYQYNNVGEFVYPGDTVSFFFEIKNPGTGKVYETLLRLSLINEDGVDVGGGVFPLGDLKQGEGFKITTGLVLADETASGYYQAHAQVFGYVGPDDEEITAWSDSFFRVVGYASYPLMPGIIEETKAIEPAEEVLGAITAPGGMSTEDKYKLFLIGLLSTYIPAKGYQKRKELGVALSKSGKYIGTKSLAMRSFFASFLA